MRSPRQPGQISNGPTTRSKAWVQANREQHKANGQRWKKENPDKAKALDAAMNSARRARKKTAEGRYSVGDVRRQLTQQGYRCEWCRVDISGGNHTVDHRIPLNKGGSNWPENIVMACATCNSTKRDMMPEDFLALRLARQAA